jgi:membrane associated rhomboid family serine protease
MIPIGDANPTRRVPIMNWLLIGANVLVFLYELQLSDRALDRFVFQWGVVPAQLLAALAHPLAASSLHAFETLLTSQFIHGGWFHIIGNMLFLFVFGDNIEDVLGSWSYLVFYLICGIVAGLAQTFVLAPFLGGVDIPSIGASGAIAGVLGAYLILFPNARIRALVPLGIVLSTFQIPALLMIGFWFVQQFFLGIMSLNTVAAQAGGVGFWAHIGGFVAGIILILPFKGRARPWQNAGYYPSNSAYDDYRRWRG